MTCTCNATSGFRAWNRERERAREKERERDRKKEGEGGRDSEREREREKYQSAFRARNRVRISLPQIDGCSLFRLHCITLHEMKRVDLFFFLSILKKKGRTFLFFNFIVDVRCLD